jgi:hypothetical protein
MQALCRRHLWLRQMISLASLVRSREHEAAPASKTCLRRPGAGLHLPCRSYRKPAPWGTRLITASEGVREPAFAAPTSATADHDMADGDTCASRACHPAWRCLSRARSHGIDDHGGRTRLHEPRGQPGCGKIERVRHLPKRPKPRPCPARRAVQHYALTNETWEPEGRPAPAAHEATAPMDGYRRRTRAGAARLPLSHPLSCASDVSAYAARRRLAARFSLARRGFFSPVRA